MTFNPESKDKLTIQRTDLTPASQKDPKGAWDKFIDGIRKTIGLKPIHLAERFAEAKVRQEEIKPEIALLEAKANYEVAMAKVRELDREHGGNSRTNAPELIIPAIKNLLEARNSSPEEKLEELEDVIKRISLQGGAVELNVSKPDS